jgi:hypothetical protein
MQMGRFHLFIMQFGKECLKKHEHNYCSLGSWNIENLTLCHVRCKMATLSHTVSCLHFYCTFLLQEGEVIDHIWLIKNSHGSYA